MIDEGELDLESIDSDDDSFAEDLDVEIDSLEEVDVVEDDADTDSEVI